MPLRLECPSCTATVNAPESMEGKKVCCPKCAYSFTALSDAPARSKPVERPRSRSDERLQKDEAPRRSAPAARAEEDELPRRSRRSIERPKKSGDMMLPLLLVGGGAGALLILVLGGVGLWWLMRPAKKTAQAEAAVAAPAPAPAGIPGAPPPVGNVPPPVGNVAPQPAVFPPAGDGDEEFVDLPERRTAAPIVPGLVGGGDEPPPPQPPMMPQAGRARVSLFNLSMTRAGARTQFRASYRFTEGGPIGPPGRVQYTWVIRPLRGIGVKLIYRPNLIGREGTLTETPIGLSPIGPYQTYFAIERRVPGRPGWQEERLSDIVTIR